MACADGRVVGYRAASGPHVHQLFVDPDHQRAGIGGALLSTMLARRLRPANLHVFATQPFGARLLRALRLPPGRRPLE